MDTNRLRAAIIRAFWTVIFPLIGSLVAYLLEPGVLEEVGVTIPALALGIGAVLYGVKKYIWPDTVM
jgi:hypothetical protein